MRKIRTDILIALLILSTAPGISIAQSNIRLNPEVQIRRDCAESEAELIIRMTIPSGTPISALPHGFEVLLGFYRDLWSGSDPILKSLLPSKDKTQIEGVRDGSKAITGVDTLLMLNRAFREVEEQGFAVFQKDVTIFSRERIPVYEPCLLENGSKNVTVQKDMNLETRIPTYRKFNVSETRQKQLTANSNMIAVSLISFRSEFGRFPTSLDELKLSGHLLISLINPYTNKPITFNKNSGPGNFAYTRPTGERYILTVFDAEQIPIKRELIARADIEFQGLLSEKKYDEDSKSFTEKEQTVRIYVYQIGQLVNSFYETYSYLPRNILFMESQGFAVLNYKNPFSNLMIKPITRIDQTSSGNYYFVVLNEDEYLLVGYGEGGRKVIAVGHKFQRSSTNKSK